MSPALTGWFFTTEPSGKPRKSHFWFSLSDAGLSPGSRHGIPDSLPTPSRTSSHGLGRAQGHTFALSGPHLWSPVGPHPRFKFPSKLTGYPVSLSWDFLGLELPMSPMFIQNKGAVPIFKLQVKWEVVNQISPWLKPQWVLTALISVRNRYACAHNSDNTLSSPDPYANSSFLSEK